MKEKIKKHLGTYKDRAVTMTAFSVVINSFTAVGKLLIGISLLSFWYIVNAVYCIALVAARIVALVTYKRARKAGDGERGLETENKFHMCGGLFIFFIAAVYFVICAYMYFKNYAIVATGSGAYAVAFITFYKLAFSIYGLIITRRMNSPVLKTMKAISLTDASLSVVITQCTLLNLMHSTVSVRSSAILGMLISAAFMVTGGVMTARHRLVLSEMRHKNG